MSLKGMSLKGREVLAVFAIAFPSLLHLGNFVDAKKQRQRIMRHHREELSKAAETGRFERALFDVGKKFRREKSASVEIRNNDNGAMPSSLLQESNWAAESESETTTSEADSEADSETVAHSEMGFQKMGGSKSWPNQAGQNAASGPFRKQGQEGWSHFRKIFRQENGRKLDAVGDRSGDRGGELVVDRGESSTTAGILESDDGKPSLLTRQDDAVASEATGNTRREKLAAQPMSYLETSESRWGG